MNHAAYCERLGLRAYKDRSYILHGLDDRHFYSLNRSPARQLPSGSWVELSPPPVLSLNGYCLDAPDQMPAGSMLSGGLGSRGETCLGMANTFDRDFTLAEREAQAQLLDELIEEINGTHR